LNVHNFIYNEQLKWEIQSACPSS